MTDSRTAFGMLIQKELNILMFRQKKIASFITLELSGRFEHLKLMEEIAILLV